MKIVWFGVSDRGPKLKTTLHGDLLLMVDNTTGLPTMDETSETIVRNLYCLFTYIHDSIFPNH